MNDMAFQVHEVSKEFDGFSLRVEHLELERGYVLGLVGPNGAGKSTLIKILLNLVYPDGGQIRILGLEQPAAEVEIRRRVGYVSEQPGFYPEMTVGWTTDFVSRYYPTWNSRLCSRYLSKFRLDRQKRVKDLSRGMRVKLALTLALSHEPDLLVLDEPTSGLDPVARHELLEEIAEVIQDERRAVLFSSHISTDIEQVADFITMIEGGRILEHAEKDELMARWKRVSGTCRPGTNLDGLFFSYDSEGPNFTGLTDHFSPRWEAQLKERGCSRLQISNVSLDEVIVAKARRRTDEP